MQLKVPATSAHSQGSLLHTADTTSEHGFSMLLCLVTTPDVPRPETEAHVSALLQNRQLVFVGLHFTN